MHLPFRVNLVIGLQEQYPQTSHKVHGHTKPQVCGAHYMSVSAMIVV